MFGIRVVKALAMATAVAVAPLLVEVSVRTDPTVMEPLELAAVPANGAPGVAPPRTAVAPLLVEQELREFLWALTVDFFL